MFNRLNQQSKLFLLFILLCILPIACLGWTAYAISAKVLESKIQEDFNVIAAQFNAAVEGYLRDFDRYSTLIYYNPQILEVFEKPNVPPDQWGYREAQDQKMIIDAILTYPFSNRSIEGIVLYGLNGSIYGYSQRVEGANTINRDYRPYEEAWFQRVVQSKGKMVITGIREEKQFIGHPTPVITVGRLLYNKNLEPIAVVTFNLSPSFLQGIIQTLQLKGAFVGIVDGAGRLVHTSDPELVSRLTLQARTADDVVPADAKVVLDIDGGGTMVGVANRSEYSQWSTYFLMDRAVLFKDSDLIRALTIFIVLGLLLISLAISWLFARGFTKPIFRLLRMMRRAEGGEFSVPELSHRQDEIGQLYHGYRQMVINIQSYIRSIEEKERQKRQAELYALRARISPHFLYNTLNSIRMLAMIQHSAQIAGLIQSFTELLRMNMKMEQEWVTLKEELELLRHYMSLMELRYTNQFSVRWEIPPDSGEWLVPPMILQPIAENAIFHGIAGVAEHTTILVEASVRPEANRLAIRVVDDGWGMEPDVRKRLTQTMEGAASSDGIGLHNVNERIRLRFGREYGIRIDSKPREGTAVTVHLPLARKEEHPEYVESHGRRG